MIYKSHFLRHIDKDGKCKCHLYTPIQYTYSLLDYNANIKSSGVESKIETSKKYWNMYKLSNGGLQLLGREIILFVMFWTYSNSNYLGVCHVLRNFESCIYKENPCTLDNGFMYINKNKHG